MTTLEMTKNKILEKLPAELRGLMEMWMDYYGEVLAEKIAVELEDDCRQLYRAGHRVVPVADLRVYALTKQKQLNH